MPAANHLVARNTLLECAVALAVPVTVTAISKATEGVVTAAAHGFANGDAVVFTASGMTEMDGQIARVSASAAGAFNLEGIDTTDFGTFTAGTVQKVTPWMTLAKAQSVEAGASSANRMDAMVLLDRTRNFVFGATESPELTVNGLSDMTSASVKAIAKASRNNALVSFRLKFIGQLQSRLFRGYVTAPGESITVDTLVTSGFSITQVGERLNLVDAA